MSEPTLDEAIASLEDFLRRYPSGHFAEIAQGKLDALLARRGEKRVSLVSGQGNPYSKGAAMASPEYRVGDRYEFSHLDGYSGAQRSTSIDVVTSVGPLEVVYTDGRYITDLLGNYIKRSDGMRFVDLQTFVPEYWVGKKWRTRYRFSREGGRQDETTVDYVVAGREEIVVPAGRFLAFRVEGEGMQFTQGRRQFTYWIAPDRVRRFLRQDVVRWDRAYGLNNAPTRGRNELVSFSEAVPPAMGAAS